MFASCLKIDLKQMVTVGVSYDTIAQCGFFGTCFRCGGSVGFVVSFDCGDIVNESVGRLCRSIACYCPIGFADVAVAEHLIEPGQCFGCLGKDDQPPHRAVKTVYHAAEYVAGFGVFFLDVSAYGLYQRFIAGLVALYDFPRSFIYDYYVVVC